MFLQQNTSSFVQCLNTLNCISFYYLQSVCYPTRNIFNIMFYTTSEFKMFRSIFHSSNDIASKTICESDRGLPEDDDTLNSRAVSCIK
jgi:hypothetical protein